MASFSPENAPALNIQFFQFTSRLGSITHDYHPLLGILPTNVRLDTAMQSLCIVNFHQLETRLEDEQAALGKRHEDQTQESGRNQACASRPSCLVCAFFTGCSKSQFFVPLWEFFECFLATSWDILPVERLVSLEKSLLFLLAAPKQTTRTLFPPEQHRTRVWKISRHLVLRCNHVLPLHTST